MHPIDILYDLCYSPHFSPFPQSTEQFTVYFLPGKIWSLEFTAT